VFFEEDEVYGYKTYREKKGQGQKAQNCKGFKKELLIGS